MTQSRYKQLLALWQSKRAGRRYPARSDFDVLELRPWLGDLELVEVERTDDGGYRYRYRLVGTRITDIDGIDATGRHADEIFIDNYSNVVDEYDEVLETGEPCLRDYSPSLSRRGLHRTYHKLVLPLASDGETIDMLLVLLEELA